MLIFLCDRNELEDYLELLVRNFNIHTVDNIMCRNLINVNWNGKMYDCDFNQQLEMDITKANKKGNLSRYSSSLNTVNLQVQCYTN